MTDLGEQPTPRIEPAEPPPGGVDAVDETLFEPSPLVPDLSHLGNERDQDRMPDEITEPDPTDTEATRGEDAAEQKESPG